MKKGLIAVMVATTITGTATALTGCEGIGYSTTKVENENEYENEIRKMLEYDANIDISKERVEKLGFKVAFEINDNRFYITFYSLEAHSFGKQVRNDEITYEVDKDTYYDFKNNYNLHKTQNEVERVKDLTEKYDPIEVVDK